MTNRLKWWPRLLVVFAALLLLVVLVFPIWRIELDAPQYPEGLTLTIHANGLKGNVDIINGLNHYIGMNSLHNGDFIEFTVLPYIIVLFAIFFIGIAVINRRVWLYAGTLLFILFGIIAMVDFWRWEYNYGHHLNPNAAIVVPGMAYQPPLIGFKQLLNFGAYSIPDIGGWLFIMAGCLLLFCTLVTWHATRQMRQKITFVDLAAMLLFTLPIASCTTSVSPIKLGTDDCTFCKMRITDARYGAEIITQKGRLFKFDDIHCMVAFLKQDSLKAQQAKDIYFADFSGTHQLVKSSHSFLLQSDSLRAPMNGKVVAFASRESMMAVAESVNGISIGWSDLLK